MTDSPQDAPKPNTQEHDDFIAELFAYVIAELNKPSP